MTKEITIAGKQYIFTSNAATPIFYKDFFKKDLMQEIKTDGDQMTIATDRMSELAFIMAKQGDKADMMHLTFENYIEWLELFNPFDLTLKGEEIFNVYIADAMPQIVPKKKARAKAKG